MPLTRYNIILTVDDWYEEPNPTGDWVRYDDLTKEGGLVERCRHTIDQLQEHLGPGSLMKADAQTLLTDLEALK